MFTEDEQIERQRAMFDDGVAGKTSRAAASGKRVHLAKKSG